MFPKNAHQLELWYSHWLKKNFLFSFGFFRWIEHDDGTHGLRYRLVYAVDCCRTVSDCLMGYYYIYNILFHSSLFFFFWDYMLMCFFCVFPPSMAIAKKKKHTTPPKKNNHFQKRYIFFPGKCLMVKRAHQLCSEGRALAVGIELDHHGRKTYFSLRRKRLLL